MRSLHPLLVTDVDAPLSHIGFHASAGSRPLTWICTRRLRREDEELREDAERTSDVNEKARLEAHARELEKQELRPKWRARARAGKRLAMGVEQIRLAAVVTAR